MDSPGSDPGDELDVIPKALIIVAANLLPIVWLFSGTTDLADVRVGSRGLFQSVPEGEAQFAVLGYLFSALSSIMMAAIALVALLGPASWSGRFLRASAALLGLAILLLAVFIALVGTTPENAWFAPLVGAIVAAVSATAWYLAHERA